MEEERVYSLPEDLVVSEILPRLPVKSLIRFKCVSKRWLAHISGESFASAHLRRASETTKLSIILAERDEDHRGTTKSNCTMYAFDHLENKFTESSHIPYVTEQAGEPIWEIYVVGSCNGLVCLCLELMDNTRAILLWNPATRETRPVPEPNTQPLAPRNDHAAKHRKPFFGFGIDTESEDYKVVRVAPVEKNLSRIQVFSARNGCWRELEKSASGYHRISSIFSIHVDGCLQWFIPERCDESNNRHHVLWLDLREESFGVKQLNYSSVVNTLAQWRHTIARLPCSLASHMKGEDFELRDRDGTVISRIEFDWRSYCGTCESEEPMLRGVSRDRFFVREQGRDIWRFCQTIHDYVPSLVSVYPKGNHRKTTKKKLVGFWAALKELNDEKLHIE